MAADLLIAAHGVDREGAPPPTVRIRSDQRTGRPPFQTQDPAEIAYRHSDSYREHGVHVIKASRPRSLKMMLKERAMLYSKCVVAIARALREADAPPHIVRAVAEACASVNARFPLQRFYSIAVGEKIRQTIIEYHTKDEEGE